MISSEFHCKENDGFRVVPVHLGLITSNYAVYEVGVTIYGAQQVLILVPGNKHAYPAGDRILSRCMQSSNSASVPLWRTGYDV